MLLKVYCSSFLKMIFAWVYPVILRNLVSKVAQVEKVAFQLLIPVEPARRLCGTEKFVG